MKKIIISFSFFAPAFAFAQIALNGPGGILNTIQGLLNVVMPILITLGVVYFLWGVVAYVTSGDAEKKEQGQQHMIWGLIGVFVMVSVWGLVAVIGNTFLSGQNNGNLGGGSVPCVVGAYDPATGLCQ